MKILVACEESQAVCIAFRAKGHEAYSCDLLLPSGGHPEWHIRRDVMELIREPWDMMIAFPPCTYLTCTANAHFVNNPERWEKRLSAMMFVHALLYAPIEKIALENPVGVISTHIRPPDQYIQPFQFGHAESKKTGLWLKNLPLLQPTKIVEPEYLSTKRKGKRYSPTMYHTSSKNRPEVARLRSKTYPGVALAMAKQWG